MLGRRRPSACADRQEGIAVRWAQPAPSCSTGNCTGTPVDNTLPFIIFACLGAAIVLYAAGRAVSAFRKKRVLTQGVPARAAVTALTSRGIVTNGTKARTDVTLAFRSADGTECEAWTTALFPVDAVPEVGGTVPVRYWPKNPERVVVDGTAALPPQPT